jgi:hypothetical protein
MLESIGLDKNHQMYCVRKIMTIAIRLPITFSAAEIRMGKSGEYKSLIRQI